MTHKDIYEQLRTLSQEPALKSIHRTMLDHIVVAIGPPPTDLEAERDRLREALTEALDELEWGGAWSEEDDSLTAETRASRARWMSKMRRIAALQETNDE